MTPLPERGLYAVTDTALTRERGLLRCVETVVDAGAVMVQYRDKTSSADVRREQASALLALCRRLDVPLIINDDLALALEVGADGVHVGRDDDAVGTARSVLGPRAIVGASCYHELDRAITAQRAGASYVAFGRFFASRTKPGRALAAPSLLEEARSRLTVPVVAIGGITMDNAGTLVRAGADPLAVIHELWATPDGVARARRIAESFDR